MKSSYKFNFFTKNKSKIVNLNSGIMIIKQLQGHESMTWVIYLLRHVPIY